LANDFGSGIALALFLLLILAIMGIDAII